MLVGLALWKSVIKKAPPTKKRKTRQTVKEENMSITAPMIEVSGPDGPMMVFRPWTVNDMKEAMAHLPSPEKAGDRFSTELVTFCKEFSPTVHELRRLLAVKLGASSWHIKLFSLVYFTVSVVRQRNEYEIVTETRPIKAT